MGNAKRCFGLFLCAIALSGCAAAVDDPEQTTSTNSEALKVDEAAKAEAVAVDPKASECAASDDKAYVEFYSTLQKASTSKDSLDLAAGNSCSAACRCCKWGNRFCCSHCRFCTGPIGTSGGVFAP